MKLSIIKIFFFIPLLAPLTADGAESWQYYLARGKKEFETVMYRDAVLSLRRALELNPESYEAANWLAESYLAMRDREKALESFRLSLAIRADQADIHNRAGEISDELFDGKEAFTHYLEAVRIDPSHLRANMNLARHYFRKGDSKTADLHFGKSLDLAMQKAGPLLLRAESAKTDDESIRLYRQAIEEAPSLVDAYLGLYTVYRKKKDYPAAAEAIERLKRVRPDYEKAYVILGNLYFAEKFPGRRSLYLWKAEKNLAAAAKINPENFSVLYTLSRVYDFMGKKALARETLEKAISLEKKVTGK